MLEEFMSLQVYSPSSSKLIQLHCFYKRQIFRSNWCILLTRKTRQVFKEECEIEKRMSYVVSVVSLLPSSSLLWSLPPWESAVWITPLIEGASGAAAHKAHPTSASCHFCKLSLRNGKTKKRIFKGEKKKIPGNEGGKCKREWVNQSHLHKLSALT